MILWHTLIEEQGCNSILYILPSILWEIANIITTGGLTSPTLKGKGSPLGGSLVWSCNTLMGHISLKSICVLYLAHEPND